MKIPGSHDLLSSARLAQQKKQLSGLQEKSQQQVKEQEALKEAAKDFEAIFTQQMLKTMRESGYKSELLPESQGEKIFRSMLDEQYAQLMAKSGNLGLAESLYQQLQFQQNKK